MTRAWWGWLGWGGLVALAVALSFAARAEPVLPGDVAVARWWQARQAPPLPVIVAVANAVSRFGVALLALAALASASRRRLDLVRLALLGILARLAAGQLKPLIARPRPSDLLIRVSERPADSSFPSGHVLTAVLCYGLLVVLLEYIDLPRRARRPAQALCLAVVLAMGPARVAVGAHWPSDVLGGYLWGAVILIALLALARRLGWLRPRPARWPTAGRSDRPSPADEQSRWLSSLRRRSAHGNGRRAGFFRVDAIPRPGGRRGRRAPAWPAAPPR